MSQSSPLSSWMPDLVTPHPNSWVAFIASMFRAMAYMILAPIIILTLTDIAAWAIARTLGASLDAVENTTLPKPKEATIDNPVQPVIKVGEDDKAAKVDSIPQLDLPPSPPTFVTDLRFTTPGEANYELSGLFSPPISRAGSPKISLSRRLRSSSTSLSAAGSDSEGTGSEGRMNIRPSLGMTPMGDGLRAPEGNMARRRAGRSPSES